MYILCKVCGAKIEFSASDGAVAVCPYCGKQSLLPRVRKEYVLNLFNRANSERLNKNFDEALSAYESIISENPEEAEAHWGAFLCEYGVEYVEDRASGARVATIHRMSEEPVLQNRHYLAALAAATGPARAMYEADAAQISGVQEKFYRITANEKPFDVFISYKETVGNGNPERTRDSVCAQEIYDGLQREGYNVFFSRITLAEKAGDSYEPIIFSALNSARVMILVGTRVEFITSTWVRNEWMRYLYIMRKKKGAKSLIVAYRDLDVFELPEELSDVGISSIDLGENGATAELIRSVSKLLGPKSQRNYDRDKLYDRIRIDLACGDFAEADSIADRILEIDNSEGRAYIAKVMCALREANEEALKQKNPNSWPRDVRANWEKGRAFMGEG